MPKDKAALERELAKIEKQMDDLLGDHSDAMEHGQLMTEVLGDATSRGYDKSNDPEKRGAFFDAKRAVEKADKDLEAIEKKHDALELKRADLEADLAEFAENEKLRKGIRSKYNLD